MSFPLPVIVERAADADKENPEVGLAIKADLVFLPAQNPEGPDYPPTQAPHQLVTVLWNESRQINQLWDHELRWLSVPGVTDTEDETPFHDVIADQEELDGEESELEAPAPPGVETIGGLK